MRRLGAVWSPAAQSATVAQARDFTDAQIGVLLDLLLNVSPRATFHWDEDDGLPVVDCRADADRTGFQISSTGHFTLPPGTVRSTLHELALRLPRYGYPVMSEKDFDDDGGSVTARLPQPGGTLSYASDRDMTGLYSTVATVCFLRVQLPDPVGDLVRPATATTQGRRP